MKRKLKLVSMTLNTMEGASSSTSSATIQELQDRIKCLEEENSRLRSSIRNGSSGSNHRQSLESPTVEGKSVASSPSAENCASKAPDEKITLNANEGISRHQSSISAAKSSLTREQVERYSRQLLLSDGFGVKGQLKLLSSSVLIVGAGGIGSTGTFHFLVAYL